MKITFKQVQLNYNHPFRISRGVRSTNTNLYVFVECDGLVGIGEVAPGSLAKCTAAEAEAMLGKLDPADLEQWSIHETWQRCSDLALAPCAVAGLDIALWDLHAKRRRSCYRNIS